MQHDHIHRTHTIGTEGQHARHALRVVAAGLMTPSRTMGSDLSDSARGLATRSSADRPTRAVRHGRPDRVTGMDVRRFPTTVVRHH